MPPHRLTHAPRQAAEGTMLVRRDVDDRRTSWGYSVYGHAR